MERELKAVKVEAEEKRVQTRQFVEKLRKDQAEKEEALARELEETKQALSAALNDIAAKVFFLLVDQITANRLMPPNAWFRTQSRQVTPPPPAPVAAQPAAPPPVVEHIGVNGKQSAKALQALEEVKV